jgi:hypothetical protein
MDSDYKSWFDRAKSSLAMSKNKFDESIFAVKIAEECINWIEERFK